jgi:RNA-splicing ligase RtcB
MTGLSDDTMIQDDQPYREFDGGRIRVYGYTYDSQAVRQISTVAGHGWVTEAALMADNHLGYSMPIGGVAGYR